MLRELTGKRTASQAVASLPAQHIIGAILAQRYAVVVDRAHDAGDDVRIVAAGEKLRAVLASLEAALTTAAPAPEGGSPDVGSTGPSGRVVELFSGVPTMGNTADA